MLLRLDFSLIVFVVSFILLLLVSCEYNILLCQMCSVFSRIFLFTLNSARSTVPLYVDTLVISNNDKSLQLHICNFVLDFDIIK